MKTLCEKCKNNEAEFTLEITLMKICKRCYLKIIQSRISSQLKKAQNTKTFRIHELSYSFFNEKDAELILDKVSMINHGKRAKPSSNNLEFESNKKIESIKVILATREIAAMLLISLLSSEKPDSEITDLMIEIKNKQTIMPLIQLSINELNMFITEEKKIELHINEEYNKINELLNDIEKTHKDASSGLSTSFMQLAEKYPE
jgi:hypothetical protein